MSKKSLDCFRRKFTPREDEIIKAIVDTWGTNKWDYIATLLPERTARQIKDRYNNYLSPDMTNLPWTREEDDLLRQKVDEYGNHWVIIATFFVGRSSNNVKNRWHKVLVKGIEPKYEDEESNQDKINFPTHIVSPKISQTSDEYSSSSQSDGFEEDLMFPNEDITFFNDEDDLQLEFEFESESFVCDF